MTPWGAKVDSAVNKRDLRFEAFLFTYIKQMK